MPDPEALAAILARAHHRPTDGLPDGPRLVDYAESARVGDWTLRSALVRFAQPEPTRAGAVLELIRRTDGALKPHRRRLEASLVPTHPALGPELVTGDGIPDGAERRSDARAADLARSAVRFPDGDVVVAAYAAAEGMGADELDAVALLTVALELDDLAEVLARWAEAHQDPPPVDVVDERAAAAFQHLTALGVPREARPRRS